MPCCGECECLAIPRMTVYDKTGAILWDRRLLRRTRENRELPYAEPHFAIPSAGFWEYYVDIPEDNIRLSWWFNNREGVVTLAEVDESERQRVWHKFDPYRIVVDGQEKLPFVATCTDTGNPREIEIVFSDWSSIIPPSVKVSTTGSCDAASPASVSLTAPHTWLLTLADDTPIPFDTACRTVLEINDLTFLLTPTTVAADLQQMLDVRDSGFVRGNSCEDDRRELYRFLVEYGAGALIDPSEWMVQVDLHAVQPVPWHLKASSYWHRWYQFEPAESTGLFDARLHPVVDSGGSIFAEEGFSSSEFRLTDGPYPATGPPDTRESDRVTVELLYCSGQWSLVLQQGDDHVDRYLRRHYYRLISGPEAPDRPATLLFEYDRDDVVRRNSVDPDGSMPETVSLDFQGLDWLAGTQMLVHLRGEDYPGLNLHFNTGLHPMALHVDASGVGGDLDGIHEGKSNSYLITDIGTYVTDNDRSHWRIGVKAGEEQWVLVQWGNGFFTPSLQPTVYDHYHQRFELWGGDAAGAYVYVPDNSDLHNFVDTVYDIPISWTFSHGLGDRAGATAPTGTVTTKMTWSDLLLDPTDRGSFQCPDCDDRQEPSPIIQRVEFGNENFLLPLTDSGRWSRIITIDGRQLAFVLARSHGILDQASVSGQAVWRFHIYDCDADNLPYLAVYEFRANESGRGKAIAGEAPAFDHWRCRGTNNLVLTWRRETEGDIPNNVAVTAEPVSNPRGSCKWTWSDATREWSLTDDQSVSGFDPVEPITRGSVDGEERWIAPSKQNTDPGEVIWWSPDGVSWEKIIQTCGETYLSPTPPSVVPSQIGQVYRALCDAPPPPPLTGDCRWQWDGSNWNNIQDDCGPGTVCDQPLVTPTTVGEIQLGNCRIVDCAGETSSWYWAGGFDGWVLIDSDCPTHCTPVPPFDPGLFIGHIETGDCTCTGCP